MARVSTLDGSDEVTCAETGERSNGRRSAAVAAVVPDSGAMSAGTILVVEDNPITRKMLRVALELEGYEVLDAAEGKTARAQAAARRPDLVILDYVLPDTDGLQLLAELRHQASAPDLPAIVITGMVSRLEEFRAR